MAVSQTDLDNLLDAIKLGIKSVQYHDRTVVYDSIRSMWETYHKLDAMLNPKKAVTYVQASGE